MRRILIVVGLILAGCKGKAPEQQAPAPAPAEETPPSATAEVEVPPPLGLFDPPPPPADNPSSVDKIALGKQLFFDKRLSKDGSMSCESCHYQDKAWTDNLPFSTRVGGEVNTRNTPTLYNVAYQTSWYLDGRATSIEAVADAAWKSQLGADPAAIATALAAIPGYKDAFQKVFGGPPSEDTVSKALATYLRTLVAANSPYDRAEAKTEQLSADAEAGKALFFGKGCITCHLPPLFSDGMFHNVGLEAGKAKPDLGRNVVSKDPKDVSAFKTPSLRAAAKGAPYFHDGSRADLEAAVRFMAGGGGADPGKDPRLTDQKLSDAEIKQVVAFIQSLYPDKDTLEKPTLP
jgi:cytochrome c peroxidase